jgi:N-acetylglutamate synthase-like GNAT family acetyltransferase
MNALKLSKATTKDIPALNKLVHSAYRGESSKKGWTTEADLLDGMRIDEERLKQMIEKEGSMILKCETGDHLLVGCVHLEKQDLKLYLGMLTASPDHQGKGIGKQLLTCR